MTSPLRGRNLNFTPEFCTPSAPFRASKKGNQGNGYVFNSQPLKRPDKTFNFFDDSKKAKYNDFSRLYQIL